MLEEVLKGDVALSVVVEVGIEDADFVVGQDNCFFEQVHEQGVESDWLREVAQVELHVGMHRGRVESSFGADRSEGLLEDGAVLGGDAQHAAREDSVLDGVLNGLLGLGPGVVSR